MQPREHPGDMKGKAIALAAAVIAIATAGVAASRGSDEVRAASVTTDPFQLVSPEPSFRFDVLRPGDKAVVTLDAAMQAIADAGQLPTSMSDERAALTRFTDLQYGPVTDGKVRPILSGVLAWVVTYGAPPGPQVGGAATGTSSATANTKESVATVCKDMAVVDATTGVYLMSAENCDSRG
jgi:hypothetical protein